MCERCEQLKLQLEAMRGALETIDQLRKRLPDPDFGEQQTTARAIGEVVRDALQHTEKEKP